MLFLLGCKEQRQLYERSFYYWKTTFDTSANDRELIDRLGVQHFYIRYADIAIDPRTKQPIPIGIIDYKNKAGRLFASGNFTPVIFITNRTFETMTEAGADSLASKVMRFVDELSNTAFGKVPKEIQIDCDWTVGTRDKYFRFLRRLREIDTARRISCTVRLYPYKYRDKMGVPPVHSAVLMCYNLGGITKAATRNSIFDEQEIAKYLTVKDYPLPVAPALPLFGWQVWFRGAKCMGIVHNSIEVGEGSGFALLRDNRYRCLQDTVIGERYFREGDELRMEYPPEGELIGVARMLERKVPSFTSIIFFDWNTQSVKKYEPTIEKIYGNR